jgi:hypothetical protein
MTEVETGRLIAVIAEIYPRFLDGRNIESTVSLWQKIFARDSYKEVEAALFAFVSTDEKGFPPAPGAIRSLLNKLQQPEGETTETEAWAMVQKATRNSIYNADKEFAALPEDVQRCVGSPSTLREWAMMDTETLNSVVSSNFMRGYRARAVQVREIQKLPPAVREVFGILGDAFRMPEARIEAPKEQPEQQEQPKPEQQYTPPGEGWKLARERIAAIRAEVEQEKLRKASTI